MDEHMPGEAAPLAASGSQDVRPASPVEEETDAAFSPSVFADLARYGESKTVAPICQWCNASLPAPDVPRCPTCGALPRPAAGNPEVPGLTMTPPRAASPGQGRSSVRTAPAASQALMARGAAGTEAQFSPYEGLTPDEMELLANSSAALRQEITQLDSREAFQPPNRDVRQQMLQIEFEADRADPSRIVDPGPLAERRSQEPPF